MRKPRRKTSRSAPPTAVKAQVVPARYRDALDTPHDHEDDSHPPLWLVWKRRLSGFPELDCVCDSKWSAEAHVLMALPLPHVGPEDAHEVWVERVPANHRFASSLSEQQMRGYHSVRAFRKRYQLDGD